MLHAVLATALIGPFAGVFGYAAWVEWDRFRTHGPAQWGPEGRLPPEPGDGTDDETETAASETPGQSAKDD